MLITDIPQLARGTHAAILTGTDVVTGEALAYPVVWADRPYDHCPRCNQFVGRDVDCPVMLNTGAGQGGQIQEYSQQHGCGEWLSVSWKEIYFSTRDATEQDILDAAHELAADLAEEIAARQKRLRTQLREELAAALKRLREPLGEDETTEDRAGEMRTGSEIEPGIYEEHGVWLAWDYDPDGSGDPITVTEADVTEAHHD